MALTIGNTNLIISTEPEYSDQIIELTSSDTSIVEPVLVSTSSSGINEYELQAKGVGTATLTATASSGATATTEVTVVDAEEGSETPVDPGQTDPDEPVDPSTIPVSDIYFHNPNSTARIESLGLSLNPDTVTNIAPYITVSPSDATDKSWTLSSSNTSVLSVLGSTVRTVTNGSCNLTVTAADGSGQSHTITVTVTAVSADSISFNTSSLLMLVGETKNLANYLTFTPAVSIYSGYNLSSSQPAIARFSTNTSSSIKAVSPGETVVTATTSSGKTATMTIIVKSSESSSDTSNIPSSFYIECSKTTLSVGESATVRISGTIPSGLDLASSGELQLTFNNSRCYVVDGPDEDGTFIIRANNSSGSDVMRMRWRDDTSGWISSDPINLTVLESSSGSGDSSDIPVALSGVSISMDSSGKIPGDEFLASVKISPTNYSPESITWSSSNTSVAIVNSRTGYVTCIDEGTVAITVDVDGVTASRTFVVGNDNGSEINPPDWAGDDEANPVGGTNVAAPLVPFTTADTYATHYAKYGKGGYRSVSNISERNAIPEARREEGMLTWVISENKLYQLRGGYWIAANFGGGSGGDSCDCRDELESRIAALEAIILKQQQDNLKKQLDSNPYTISISNLSPSGSKFEVGESLGRVSFNYSLSGPSPIPAMQSAIIDGATVSNPSGTYTGNTVDSSTVGNKTLYSIKVKYFDTRYSQLEDYKDAGGKQMETQIVSKSIMFGYKIYCGSTTLEPENFTWANLNSSIIGGINNASIYSALPVKSSPLSFRYSVTRGRAWVAYPKAWGQSVDIQDSLGQSYATNFSFKEITVPVASNSTSYYVYYLTYPSDVIDFEFNFSKK